MPAFKQTLWLFCYLTYQADWVSRESIMALFWPDVPEAKARQNLRALLYKAKKESYAQGLEQEEQRLRWLADTDVAAFHEAISRAQWCEAVKLYQGAFLEQYHGKESIAFENWLEQVRDELYAAWRDAALHLAAEVKEDDLDETINLLQAVLRYDFLAEDVVQACMKVQALAGQKAAALQTFETFRQELGRELDIEPLKATLELAKAIRRGELGRQKPMPARAANKALPLPQSLSPFIGRTLELLELRTLLSEPQHRLITLLGPGGMGKTRLALQVMKEAQDFADGVVFVPLAPLRSASDIPDAVASALALELSGGNSVAEEVFAYLKDKQMLLLLDNIEHLLEGVSFIAQLLVQAPHCTLLSTSRVLLGIAGEVVYDVSGLTVPSSPDDSDLEAYDAAQLFLRTARRVRSDFSLTRTDYPALFELCQILNGMPLALELAANWVRLFSLPDLLVELKRDFDLLEASNQFGERHQSLRKVFDYSWQHLSPEEQRSLAALAIFRGGFSRDAASEVVELSVRTLLLLVNKSLVNTGPTGRFFVLEIIRQYAKEKCVEEQALEERHGRYYLRVLLEIRQGLAGSAPGELLGRLEFDLENIRSAWQWALHHERFDLLKPVVEPLRIFLMAKARVQEGISFFEQALRLPASRQDPIFLASVYLELAYFFRRADQYQEARAHAENGLAMLEGLAGLEQLRVQSLCELAHIRTRMGDFAEGLSYAGEALKEAEKIADAELMARCRSRLALAKTYLGNFEEARSLYQEILAYQRKHDQQIAMLRTLSDLGRLLVDMRKPLEARLLFQEGLELAQSQNLPYELGFMWEGLSQCSYLLGDYHKAQQQAELALTKSEDVNDLIGVAVQCTNLAKIQLALNQHNKAEGYLKRALEISWSKGEIPEVLRIFLVWAPIFVAKHIPTIAADMLLEVIEHPGAEYVHKQEARALFESLDKTFRPKKSLEAIVNDLRRLIKDFPIAR